MPSSYLFNTTRINVKTLFKTIFYSAQKLRNDAVLLKYPKTIKATAANITTKHNCSNKVNLTCNIK